MSSTEAKEREIRGNLKDSNWTWPSNKASKREIKKLVAIALEIAVKFFFENFLYKFGGEVYLQSFGGAYRSTPNDGSLSTGYAILV